MEQSILQTIKQALGIQPDYDVFDMELVMHINSVLSTMRQLGIGPVTGFAIQDAEAKWPDFYQGDKIHNVRSLVFMKVKMIFDPPTLPHVINAYESMIEEETWRLTIHDIPFSQPPLVLDGGSPSGDHDL